MCIMCTLLGLDKTADYETLKEWCLTVFDYLLKQDSHHVMLVDYGKNIIAILDKKKKRKEMRDFYKELHWLVKEDHFSPIQLKALNLIITKKFGHCISDVEEQETKAIEKIIKRGRIRNDTEYRLVWQREDEIYTDDSQFEYAETLRKLLSDYEDQKEIK